MRLLRCIAAVLLMFIAGTVFADLTAAPDVAFTIQYEDKELYVPGSTVLMKFTITNDASTAYSFRIAENRMFNVDFHVRTLSNVPLEPAPHFTTERTSNQQLYYRDVVLEPGEQFSFVEDLNDYVLIEDPGIFVVRASFYPDLVGTAGGALASNPLSMTIRPDLTADERVAAMVDDRTNQLLETAALPPDEIVAYIITALQDGAWNRYFLYMDLEGLLQSDAARARAYARLSEPDRRNELASFASDIEQSLIDPFITAIPSDYTMVRTTYDPYEATVVMDEQFDLPTYTEYKRYTYFLRRRDAVWYIYDYSVTNLGSE